MSQQCHGCRSGQLSRESSKAASQSQAQADDAQRRFGNAKSISSSMYDEDANKANDFEKQAMLSKFSVSTSDVGTFKECYWLSSGMSLSSW